MNYISRNTAHSLTEHIMLLCFPVHKAQQADIYASDNVLALSKHSKKSFDRTSPPALSPNPDILLGSETPQRLCMIGFSNHRRRILTSVQVEGVLQHIILHPESKSSLMKELQKHDAPTMNHDQPCLSAEAEIATRRDSCQHPPAS